jgi:hypothetical protein|tara:strand:+ start:1350 stop:1940 length:591 start_codon:yes stop_codon:yes gene_type:complete
MKLHDTYLSEVIKEYKDIVPKVLCKELIEFFEESITFRIDDHRKQSQEMQLMGDPRPQAVAYKQILYDLIYPLGEKYERELHTLCHTDYMPADEPMTKMFQTGFRSLQIQKYTSEDKGYPAVHIESGPNLTQIYLAVIVFLNDVEKGGQTVFSMGGTAIQPETGKVAIWPPCLPFYHCGRKSESDKYILTSWFEFL